MTVLAVSTSRPHGACSRPYSIHAKATKHTELQLDQVNHTLDDKLDTVARVRNIGINSTANIIQPSASLRPPNNNRALNRGEMRQPATIPHAGAYVFCRLRTDAMITRNQTLPRDHSIPKLCRIPSPSPRRRHYPQPRLHLPRFRWQTLDRSSALRARTVH